MKKLFFSLAVFVMALCANAQTNQYFWFNGNLILGNPIAQIDSVTFGNEDTDSILIYLPRTIIKEVHDTVYITIHDTVCPNDIPEGALPGKFSVSPTKQVYFSKGNLMYNLGEKVWKLAENQYDYAGYANELIGDTLTNTWVDAFCWSTESSYYGVNPCYDANCYLGEFVDWGSLIDEGWYTLSNDEWYYLINTRPSAGALHGIGVIDGVNGLILFPDNYINPSDSGFVSLCNERIYTLEQWRFLENAGAVFLPCSGFRTGTEMGAVNYHGNYWTSTSTSPTSAKEFWFKNCGEYFTEDEDGRRDGQQVRLVYDVAY